MTFEYLNDFRCIWMNFRPLNDFLVFEFGDFDWFFWFINDFRLIEWYSRIWMILEYLDIFRVINDFRVLEWFSSIWMNFEPLNDFLVFEFGDLDWLFWFIIHFRLFEDSRLLELLPSIPMIVEYLNDYRDFWLFSRIWKIFEHLDEIRVHDWF